MTYLIASEETGVMACANRPFRAQIFRRWHRKLGSASALPVSTEADCADNKPVGSQGAEEQKQEEQVARTAIYI
jgi:hypothetical protein